MAKMILVNYKQGDQVSISGSDQPQIALVCEAVTRLRDSLFTNYNFEDLGNKAIPNPPKPSTYYLKHDKLCFADHTGTKLVEYSIDNNQYNSLQQLFGKAKSNLDPICETLKQITASVPGCTVPLQYLIEMKVTPQTVANNQTTVDAKLLKKAHDFKNRFLEQRRAEGTPPLNPPVIGASNNGPTP